MLISHRRSSPSIEPLGFPYLPPSRQTYLAWPSKRRPIRDRPPRRRRSRTITIISSRIIPKRPRSSHSLGMLLNQPRRGKPLDTRNNLMVRVPITTIVINEGLCEGAPVPRQPRDTGVALVHPTPTRATLRYRGSVGLQGLDVSGCLEAGKVAREVDREGEEG
jgi:hypothetical protein